MQVSDVAVEAVRILTQHIMSAATSEGEVGQGVATRLLADLVSERMRRRSNGREWEDFTRDPRNGSLVEYLLRQAVEQDDDFRCTLVDAVRGAKAESPSGASVNSLSIGGD